MHRVVRLTFADDQRMEISVARDRSEADQNLSSRKIDLIIAYLRFDGLTDPRYFESLRLVTPRILLLAESEENIEPYVRVGLNNVLRKPFHSDELRQTVEDMLAQSGSSAEIPPVPAATVSAPMVPPAPPPGFSAPVAPPAPPPGFSAPVAPPAPPPGFSAQVAPSPSLGSKPPANSLEQSSGAEPATINEPQITLDLSFMQMSIEPNTKSGGQTVNSAEFGPSPASMISFSPEFPDVDGADTHSFAGNEPTSLIPPPPASQPMQPSPPSPSAMQARPLVPPPAPRKTLIQAIEPAPESSEPFVLEEVMVSAKYNTQVQQPRGREISAGGAHSGAVARPTESVAGVSRQEVEKIVGEAVESAVSKAVRQALTDTIPDLRQALVVEVSQRAVEQLTEELLAVKKALREQMLTDIRDVSAQWLRKETPNLAKDVIREEIRRVIEQL
jgi:DNA-binding response OmpR family regulator